MKIHIKESTYVRPAQETPNHCLQLSNLDLLARTDHVPTVYFYQRPNDSSNFFDIGLLKETLSKVLVPFYPMAGRFGRDENGRIEVKCNGEGVLFVEAAANCVIDDLGDFTEGPKLLLFVPTVDYTKGMSSYPFVLIQVTRFNCGGVCVGIAFHHSFTDATSNYQYFLNSWAEMTRGVHISVQPLFERTVLDVGLPTPPTFHHVEYNPPPSVTQNPELQSIPKSVSSAVLKLSPDQISILKAKSKKDIGSPITHSTFQIITAHIWRCLCRARALSDDQASKAHIATNGRPRLNPPIPSGYVGNVVFTTTSVALSGDIQSESLHDTTHRIHKALKRMDDEYLKSILSYLKQQPDPTVLRRGAHTYKCPNFNISDLSRMPIYDANFRWGRPVFVRSVSLLDGLIHIFPSPKNDGCLNIIIGLETHHIQLFEKFFYEIFVHANHVRSRY